MLTTGLIFGLCSCIMPLGGDHETMIRRFSTSG